MFACVRRLRISFFPTPSPRRNKLLLDLFRGERRNPIGMALLGERQDIREHQQ